MRERNLLDVLDLLDRPTDDALLEQLEGGLNQQEPSGPPAASLAHLLLEVNAHFSRLTPEPAVSRWTRLRSLLAYRRWARTCAAGAMLGGLLVGGTGVAFAAGAVPKSVRAVVHDLGWPVQEEAPPVTLHRTPPSTQPPVDTAAPRSGVRSGSASQAVRPGAVAGGRTLHAARPRTPFPDGAASSPTPTAGRHPMPPANDRPGPGSGNSEGRGGWSGQGPRRAGTGPGDDGQGAWSANTSGGWSEGRGSTSQSSWSGGSMSRQ